MVSLQTGLGGPRGFGENILGRTDDGSSEPIDLTPVFEDGLNFFGSTTDEIFLNANGSITFNSPRSQFTPDVITAQSNNPEITPYFGDVDTRLPNSNLGSGTTQLGSEDGATLTPTPGGNSTGADQIYYDLDPQNDQVTFTWDDVGFFDQDTSKLNAFQLILTDAGGGNFDIEFRYEGINWTTGDASGGQDGLGGTPARAGWTAGTGNEDEFFELPQSGNEAEMLDLETIDGNTGQPGRWFFNVRNGDVVESGVPERPEDAKVGASHGDPHIVTFDGFAYDFMATGEYVLANEENGPIQIQARQEPVTSNLTVNTAVATTLGDSEVMVDATDEVPLQINGTAADIANFDTIQVGTGIIGREDNVYTIVYPGDDEQVNAGDERLIVEQIGDRVDLRVEVSGDRSGGFEGLLSDANMDTGNDVATADGEPLPRPLPFDELYGEFRSDWRIDNQDESLFTYDEGESPDSFFDPDIPGERETVDDLPDDEREEAEAAAEDAGLEPGTAAFNAAVLDFAATGDSSFIGSALDAPTAQDEDEQGGDGNPPRSDTPNVVALNGESQTLAISFAADVRGTAANETLQAEQGAFIQFAGDGDEVEFGQQITAYQFTQAGNQIIVENDTVLAEISLNGDVKLSFADGSATASIAAGDGGFGITLGGQQLGTNFSASDVSLDADDPSALASGGGGGGGGLPPLPADGGPAPVDAGTSSSENINGNQDATIAGDGGEDRFIFGQSTTSATISDFAEGDQLFFEGGIVEEDIGVTNGDLNDGQIELAAGQVSVTLDNLGNADGRIFSVATFRSELGDDALGFA